MNIFDRIKYEFSLLGDAIKVVFKTLFYVLLLCIIYKIMMPLIKYHLPKDLAIETYENIAGFVIIGLVFFSLIISYYLEKIFKNQKK